MGFRSITSVIILAILSLFTQYAHSQDIFEPDVEVFSNSFDAEKIYLQLSGNTFNTSETIWFKAVVTDVYNHELTTRSGVLHVELIDPLDNRILDKNLLKITNGISTGFFQLHSSYQEGTYIVRGYTEWNKNFGSDFICSVPINIFRVQREDSGTDPIRNIVLTKDLTSKESAISTTIDINKLDSLHSGEAKLYMKWKGGSDSIQIKPKNKKSYNKVQYKVPLDVPVINFRLQTKNEVYTKSIVLNEDHGSLQFFPEGGSLVDGLQSAVGFKYLDYQGKGKQIQGIIVDSDNKQITEFNSNIFGMGKMIIIPEEGKKYYGLLTTKSGNTMKFELPQAKKSGLVLSLVGNEPNRELRIWNSEKNNDQFFIRFFHRGKNLYYLKARFVNGRFSYTIQSDSLPHGVIGFTVYDKEHKPIAERHFFNKINNEGLNIEMELSKNQFTVRESVPVSISTKIKGRPVPASLSIMAIDSSYFFGTNLDRNTIVSYFLLQSDIKGNVQNPSYYFESDENFRELDYLMLTQGWTNYKYKEKKRSRLFDAEKGLAIKGSVNLDKENSINIVGDKKYELNLLLMGDRIETYKIESGSDGHFKFELADSYGNGRNFVMQPTAVANKSGNLKINIQEYEVPEIKYNVEKIIVPADQTVETKVVEKINRDIRLDPFLLPSTIALNEVVVSDYKITPERNEMLELHGMPDVVIENKELANKQKKWTRSLYRWLLFNYPDEIRVKRINKGTGFEVAYVPSAGWTYVVIDGIPIHERDYRLIGTIPVTAVKSAEIIYNTNTANTYHGQVFDCAPICPPPPFPAILAIYTYSGKGLSGAFPKAKRTNLINDVAPQFTAVREFYVPKYQEPSEIDWSMPDARSLLHWTPNLSTDQKGQAELTYFNSDLTGSMVILCEGITSSGKVGYSELFYTVDNQ